MSHSYYLENVFQPKVLKKTVDLVSDKLEQLKQEGLEFDAIAFRWKQRGRYRLSCII